MKFFANIINNLKEYKGLCEAIEKGQTPVDLTGLHAVHKAHFVHAICKNNNKKAILIAQNELEAQKMTQDLKIMGSKALFYPAKEVLFSDIKIKSLEYEQKRLAVLLRIICNDFDVIVTCMDAALQYTMSKEIMNKNKQKLKLSQQISIRDLMKSLVLAGYERCEQVEGIGQFSVRGDIFDVFTPGWKMPIRIEFFGDEIESISCFNAQTQRRGEELSEVIIIPCIEIISENKTTLFSYFKNSLVFMSEPQNINEQMKALAWRWQEDAKEHIEQGLPALDLGDYFQSYDDFQSDEKQIVYLNQFIRNTKNKRIDVQAKQISAWDGSVKSLLEILNSIDISLNKIIILAGNERAGRNLCKDLQTENINSVYTQTANDLSPGLVTVMPGSLSAGFCYQGLNFTLITHGQISLVKTKNNKKAKNTKAIYSLEDIAVGEYVVHSAHGIGIFEGIQKIETQGIIKDYIKISYLKSDCLYVPAEQLDMVSKYIGPKEDSKVKLNRLGSGDFQRAKNKVRKAVKEIAEELIEIYSRRMKTKGYAFPEDDSWQNDFDANFEYEETGDQLRCIEEIKTDMQSSFPMDRLLCGDVGFGKTEVALRAAFKCISNSKQCVMLVPTTILAWQHYQTIKKRFESFPVKIELLSRFKTPSQQKEVIKALAKGSIDMVVGTHRLVQKDVKFRDLGLVIIDEEQRFGVAQKEKFKNMYENVDILTLSATPIPRTLNMAISGIRDMSTLEESPSDRYPVQTYVLEHDAVIIREAIRKELQRGGQVYYLHNNVESIERISMALQMQLPNARVGYGHGKMSEKELSQVWRSLVDHEIDILVCTTIIETGVDIPNVNTLIIENADRMGLSVLHQIRGRVGRSSRRAYAYFTFKKDKILTEIAQKRLDAIKEYTQFGSGFKIAMRDLELRGAGNILSGAQHGHMSDVGYDMYIKLLRDAINEEKGQITQPSIDANCLVDVNVSAHIPEDYIKSLGVRLDIYRQISDINTEQDAENMLDELKDRFGEIPSAVKNLVNVALIRRDAINCGIYEIKQKQNIILLFKEQIDKDFLKNIIKALKGGVMLSGGEKPYISLKIDGKNPINVLRACLQSSRHILLTTVDKNLPS